MTLESQALDVPELVGTSIRLHPFIEADIPAVLEASRDPLIPLITTVPDRAERALAAAYVARQHDRARTGAAYSFAIAEANGGCVGQIGLSRHDMARGRGSIGYWIRPSARGRGFATDALATITSWAWQLPWVHRLELYVEPWNEGSWRTAERVGYLREGLLHSWENVGQERRDMYMYALIRPLR